MPKQFLLRSCLSLLCGCLAANILVAQDAKKQSAEIPAAALKPTSQESSTAPIAPNSKISPAAWRPLLKKDSLEGWEVTNFGGEGAVKVTDGQLILETGNPLTGVTSTLKDFPTEDFEIRLEAQRIDGGDFLCGLTFPVGKGHASLIGGGWGGGVVGLSSVDGNDASENSTSGFRDFKNGKWYKFRVRVDKENITGWVDEDQIFKQEREGHDFSVRAEVLANRPLGYCVFQSKVAVKNFEWRVLTAADAATKSESPSSDGK